MKRWRASCAGAGPRCALLIASADLALVPRFSVLVLLWRLAGLGCQCCAWLVSIWRLLVCCCWFARASWRAGFRLFVAAPRPGLATLGWWVGPDYWPPAGPLPRRCGGAQVTILGCPRAVGRRALARSLSPAACVAGERRNTASSRAVATEVPRRLWALCLTWVCRIV